MVVREANPPQSILLTTSNPYRNLDSLVHWAAAQDPYLTLNHRLKIPVIHPRGSGTFHQFIFDSIWAAIVFATLKFGSELQFIGWQ